LLKGEHPGRSPRLEHRQRQGQDQRAGHFGRDLPREVRHGLRRISFSCSSVLFRFLSSRSSAGSLLVAPGDAIIDVSELEPAVQARVGDPEVLRNLRQRNLAPPGAATTSRRNSMGERLRHVNILAARRNPHRQGVNEAGGSPVRAWSQYGKLVNRDGVRDV
jgi:hypothetical protein